MARFGLICPIQRRDAGLDVLLGELAEEVLAAEQAGFDGFFLPEFHQAHGGALVSPMLIGAWLAARTTRIRVGALVLAGPLHDPVRLAEDILMLDWATRGRVILGLGTAHQPPDFELFGVERDQRQAILDELLDVVEACLAGEPFDYAGRFFTRRGQVTPGAFSSPRPPIWIGAHGPRGLRRAAERADAWVCDPQRDIDAVARLADHYRAAALAAGRPGQVALFREAWIAADRAEAEQVWAPHAMKVHRLYFNVGVYRRQFEPWVEQIRSREDFTLERLAPGRFLYGSGRRCARRQPTGWRGRARATWPCGCATRPGRPTSRRSLRSPRSGAR